MFLFSFILFIYLFLGGGAGEGVDIFSFANGQLVSHKWSKDYDRGSLFFIQ